MRDRLEPVLLKAMAIGTAALMVAALSAIAVVRADNRTNGSGNVAAGQQAGANSSQTEVLGESVTNDGSGATGSAAGGATTGGATGPAAAAGTKTAAAKAGTAAGPGGGRLVAHSGTDCPDYNPNIGVFCDKYLVGGTTVLSGPLAVYGDQGLKGGLAFLAWYNANIAAKEQTRQAKLIWYNDDLDPNKTLQYVQRLNEVDKVLYLAGITSPEATSKYIETAKFPLIGDIGLSPKSYQNPYIFATSPSEQLRNPLRVKLAKERFHVKSFAVVQDVLPSVDDGPLKGGWEKGSKDYGVDFLDYAPISSTSSDCSGQFARVIQKKPEYLVLPTATGVLLACLREAKKFSVQPGGPNSPWLKGWTGGSNLQVEVDNCKPLCEGMLSIGTIFADPRVSQTEQMRIYRENMARYAPNVDITGFIAINYYHNGWVLYNLIKSAGITWNLSRETLVKAAENFGPFDTGFGNVIKWGKTLPREPWNCSYPVVVKGDKWVFESQKTCV
ncbi:MAG: branched-chain amino acid transport system substrate-binding protein [Actinomycetota bacterium]|nr:branched-chain amino acid transport system substrate-binding protein [Actinomycetota bacterium]